MQRFRSKPTFATNDVPRIRRPIALMSVATALLFALGVAGCGSSSSSSDSTSTAAISKSEFLANGNAICTKGNAQTNAAANKTFDQKQPTQAQLTAFGTAQIPIIQRQIDQIRALGVPSGDEATVKQMLDLAQSDLDKIKADPATASSSKDVFANFAKIAHPYGLTACDKAG